MFFVSGMSGITARCLNCLFLVVFCVLSIFFLFPLKSNGCSEEIVCEGSEIVRFVIENCQLSKKSQLNKYAALSRNPFAKKRTGTNLKTELVDSYESGFSYGIYVVSESLVFWDEIRSCFSYINRSLSRSPPLYFHLV